MEAAGTLAIARRSAGDLLLPGSQSGEITFLTYPLGWLALVNGARPRVHGDGT